MPRKRYKPEEIVAKLRQVDVLVSQGADSDEAGPGFRSIPGHQSWLGLFEQFRGRR